jgi:NTP pyrophosphatase (non-canonical NTP hydrolase)
MDLNKAIEKTKKVSDDMISHGAKEWDTKTRFTGLVEEVGELANAILLEHKDKPEVVRRAELIDSICDVLFMLLRIAEAYDIDLNKEYPKVLEHIRMRFKDGKYSDNYGLQKDK